MISKLTVIWSAGCERCAGVILVLPRISLTGEEILREETVKRGRNRSATALAAEPGVPTVPAAPDGLSVRRRRRAMLAMVVLTSLANALNYASSLVFSRVLAPVGFGELTSLLALSVVVSVPLGAAQTVVAERVSVASAMHDSDRLRYLVRYAVGHVAAVGAVVTAIYVACIPLVVGVLSIREPGPALALAPLIMISFITPVTAGVLQGLERYVAFGALLIATAASRLLFGIPWVVAGGGAGGAIGGQAGGIAVVTLIVGWRYRRLVRPRGSGAARSGLRRRVDLRAVAASGAFVGFALLSNLDILLSRLWLSIYHAGIYAAIATIAKIVIFLPSAVAVIMVPNAARAHAADGSSRRVLRFSALAIGGTAALCLIPAVLMPDVIVRVMFGEDYREAAAGVLPAVLAGSLLAVLYLLCVYSVTVRDHRWPLLLVAGVAVDVGAIGVFHASPASVIWAHAGAILVVLVANELFFTSLLPRRWRA